MAQVNVSGTVVDKDSNEPLTGASVIVKGADGKIKKYATSKGDGGFAMSLPSVAGCRLEVSMMSFAKQSIPLDSVSFPFIVQLEPGTTLLKEVTVKADRIREQGDTITYNVGSFAQQQENKVENIVIYLAGRVLLWMRPVFCIFVKKLLLWRRYRVLRLTIAGWSRVYLYRARMSLPQAMS